MRGGSLNYLGYKIDNDLFRGSCNIHYSELNNKKNIAIARGMNPMNDKELSELVYDMGCLLHSLEWFKSGDISEDSYMEHCKIFKNKWFKRTREDVLAAMKDDLKGYYDDLIKEIDKYEEEKKCKE